MIRSIIQKVFMCFVFFLGVSALVFIQAAGVVDALPAQSTCGNVGLTLTPSFATFNDQITVDVNLSNNQCVMSAFGFDLYFDDAMFTFQGIEAQGTLITDWSMIDGNEINPGQVRVGGYSGMGTEISASANGCLIKVKFQVAAQCGAYADGDQGVFTLDSYFDDLVFYAPQPAQVTFTLLCCGGDIALPTDLSGAWGDLVPVPVSITNNSSQICDFEFDFIFDSSVLEIRGVERSPAIQDWTTLNWNLLEPGKARITGSAGSGTCVAALSSADLVFMTMMVRCVDLGGDTLLPIRIESYSNGIAGLCPRSFEADLLYEACPRLGDVNGDGNVTPGDAQTAFEIFLGKIVPSSLQLTTADANSHCPCDGLEHLEANNCITPGDAQWIFEHFLMRRVLPQCSADYVCPSGSASVSSRIDMPRHGARTVYPLPTAGRQGERVMIPVMVDNPAGIRDFSLDMVYPHELLEYVGVLSSPLTHGFAYVRGEEGLPGVVRLEGRGEEGIAARGPGSLCVAVFQVKEGVYGEAAVELYSLDQDIFDAKAGHGRFRVEHPSSEPGNLALGRAKEQGGRLIVPVRVTDAFDLKAFGLELKYPTDKLAFVGVEQTELTRDFVSLDGNEVAAGVARVGGYCLSGIQDESRGVLVRLVFEVKEPGGVVEIVEATDDLARFAIIR